MRLAAIIFSLFLIPSQAAAEGQQIPLREALNRALEQSSLTSAESIPFHLKLKISEKGEPGSDFNATVEEYWVAPNKWTRTIVSENFSQTRTVNGDAVYEKNTGDYFPQWLRGFISAVFDPIPKPMYDALQTTQAQVTKPNGDSKHQACSDFHMRVDRWVICFEGSRGLFESIFTKGYAAQFSEYKRFGKKDIPRLIENDPEPGTHLEARILELSELKQPDDSMFTVAQPTPLSEQIRTVQIDEETFRRLLLSAPEIHWPPVGEGSLKGGCAAFATADKAGQVREVWPGGCDNAALEGPLRDAVKLWKLKAATVENAPVQVEALLGFSFQTVLDAGKKLPELTDPEVRALRLTGVEPNLNGKVPAGTEIKVRISVDETGKVTGIENPQNLDSKVFLPISNTVVKWTFRPYVKDGKAQYFHAELVFKSK